MHWNLYETHVIVEVVFRPKQVYYQKPQSPHKFRASTQETSVCVPGETIINHDFFSPDKG